MRRLSNSQPRQFWDTPLTIKYPDSRKFDVNVDGVYIGSGLSGTFTTSVQGGMNHDIRVWDGLWDYQKSIWLRAWDTESDLYRGRLAAI